MTSSLDPAPYDDPNHATTILPADGGPERAPDDEVLIPATPGATALPPEGAAPSPTPSTAARYDTARPQEDTAQPLPQDDPQHATSLLESSDPVDPQDDEVLVPATPGAGALPPEGTSAPAGRYDVGTASAPAGDEWLELQGRFVDDPAAAVREAGERLERELAELRGRHEGGDTEALRSAFKRYRALHETLRST